MSTSANTFTCPTCGAALLPNGNAPEVKCEYCGNVVVVPETLRVHTSPQAIVFGQGTAVPPEALQAIEQLVGEVGHMNFQQGQIPPQFGQSSYQPMAPVQQRRRGGCGCFGCLGFIAVLLVILLIGLGIFVAVAPAQINQVLTQVNAVVQPAVATIGTFSVDPSQVPNNGVVTLRWAVNIADGSSTFVSLDRIANGVTTTLLRGLPSVGSNTQQVQGKPGDKITFKLVTTKNGVSTDRLVIVTIR